MPGLPAQCERCGHIFLSDVQFEHITINNARGFIFRCPECGGDAPGLDGSFSFSEDNTTIKYATSDTQTKLKALRQALKAAQENKSIEEVIAPLQEASPQLAELTASAARRGGMATVAALLLYLVASCSQNTKGTMNWNQLVDQGHVYMTNAAPYPGLGTASEPQSTGTVEEGQQSRPEERSGPSRQQRRQQERQAKKQQQRIGRQTAPTRHRSKTPKG
ncbi:hypothetical protein ABIE45_002758 [Methylobacterium sp. OAE515]|uniref:hypothetical protein n=1 Tax=Methylobacterium sp. OAE515 TaxID=2817895 RepID=UPI00178AE3B2